MLTKPTTQYIMRIANIYQYIKILFLTLIFTSLLLSCTASPPALPNPTPSTEPSPVFQGERALEDVATQLDFGIRVPGSVGHQKTISWIEETLRSANWDVAIQKSTYGDYTIQNIVAKRGQGAPWVILGAHYDTRIYADRDPDANKRTQPVPGANDGASGVGVLLEIARVLPEDFDGTVWLVFFDAEDNGMIADWDWIMGSRAFVDQLEGQPDAVVVVDMVGDADLNIYREKNSDQPLTQEIWRRAEALGYSAHFIPSSKYRITDDHVPFLEAGIPSVDIIDFDYPYWHTTEDTLDKVSAESLKIVGDVVLNWLLTKLSIKTVP